MKKLLSLIIKKKNKKRSLEWDEGWMKGQLTQMAKMNQRIISMSGGR